MPTFASASAGPPKRFGRGIYLHPFHNMFICAAHTEDDVRRTLEATDGAFEALKKRQPFLGPVEKLAAFAEMR